LDPSGSGSATLPNLTSGGELQECLLTVSREEPRLPKVKSLSESEEPEGTESIRFTARGLDQELIRQAYLGFQQSVY